MAYKCSLYEEQSSKCFYKSYTNKTANPDVTSIHITPDWDDPDHKEGVSTDPEEIANEFAKYDRWLFKPKPSNNNERMLSLLAADPISTQAMKSMEKEYDTQEACF